MLSGLRLDLLALFEQSEENKSLFGKVLRIIWWISNFYGAFNKSFAQANWSITANAFSQLKLNGCKREGAMRFAETWIAEPIIK